MYLGESGWNKEQWMHFHEFDQDWEPRKHEQP